MTVQEIIDCVLGNIGGRYEGLIGSSSPEDAALREVNFALNQISKHVDDPLTELSLEASMSLGQYVIPMPTSGGNNIRSLQRLHYNYSNSTDDITLPYIPFSVYSVDYLQNISSSSGLPIVFTYFADSLYLFPKLSQDITLKIWASIKPGTLTGASLTSPVNIEEDWNDTIIAYATYKLMLALQQGEDYILWLREYQRTMKENKHSLRKRRTNPDFASQDVRSRLGSGYFGNPESNPFVQSYPNRGRR